MTTFITISQLVSGLRELNVIKEVDQVEYNYSDGLHSITISTTLNSDEVKTRYSTIHQLFLKSFSESEISMHYYCDNRASFGILN